MDNLISKRVETWRRRNENENDNENNDNLDVNVNQNDNLNENEDEDENRFSQVTVPCSASAWPSVVLMDVEILSDSMADKDDSIDDAYEQAFRAVKGDDELTAFVQAIRDINDFDGICRHLKKDKDSVYNLMKRLKR